MKRSQINEIIHHADAFMKSYGFLLPAFAKWAPQKLKQLKPAGIIEARLGWDITDYGAGNFDEMGLFLFTLRNGRIQDLKNGSGMLYAEKIMISRQNQLSPMHRHITKTEDIINRGGGTLVIELFANDQEGNPDKKSLVRVPCDGQIREMPAGAHLKLQPGESVTLVPGIWHAFWAEDADVLIGEVSTVNDDLNDNIFAQPIGRFSNIEEDTDPLHLLVSDYDKWLA